MTTDIRVQIQEEICRLQAALVALGGNAPVKPSRASNGARPKQQLSLPAPGTEITDPAAVLGAPPIRKGKFSTEDVLATIVETLKTNDGLRSEEIGKLTGLDKVDLVKAFTQGLQNGQLRKKGERRGTKYYVAKMPGQPGAVVRRGK